MTQVKRNIATRLDIADYEKLKAIAESEGRSISNKLKMITLAYLKTRYMPRKKEKEK